jgi:hypothetical protein
MISCPNCRYRDAYFPAAMSEQTNSEFIDRHFRNISGVGYGFGAGSISPGQKRLRMTHLPAFPESNEVATQFGLRPRRVPECADESPVSKKC